MEQNSGDQISFPIISDVNASRYGFTQVNNNLIFTLYKNVNDLWKNFILKNFEDFSFCYYKAMEFDAIYDKSRKRKLLTFLKSIFDQNNMDVSLVMVKAITYFLKNDVDEFNIIENIIKDILPNCCFIKKCIGGKYIWDVDPAKKFKLGIGKVFVLNYINNNFDKDATWKFIKKHCFYKNGVWVYKDGKAKEVINESVKNYLKSGGILVEEKLDSQKFEAFIPLKLLNKDVSGSARFTLEKSVGDGKRVYLKGIASTTGVDRDDERVSTNFIKKMKDVAVGLPIFVKSHRPSEIEDTIGVITDTYGDENEFGIEAKLMKAEDNENVAKIIKQLDDDILYGFSVGGKITKAFREFNETLKKEVMVIDDGELYHVLLTNQPANGETFAETISKSLNKDNNAESGREKLDKMYQYKHSSRLHKEEVDADSIDKSALPDTAYPINHQTKEVSKDYAHHFVSNDVLYLHKGLLIQAYNKAVKDKAPEHIVNHLRTHLQIIGLDKQVEEMQNIIDHLENLDDVQGVLNSLVTELTPFFKAINSVRKLNAGIDDKKKMLKHTIDEVSTKIETILSQLDVEDES